MIRISIRITNGKKAFLYLLLCFFCLQDKGKMFALKSVKKNPKLITYAYTEKRILEKISHVSYWAVSSVRKPVDLIRILPEASNIFNSLTPPTTSCYLALHTKNPAYLCLETVQDLSFIVENNRLPAHQLKWVQARLIKTDPLHFTVRQTVLYSFVLVAVV
jgi:hypothetical protein